MKVHGLKKLENRVTHARWECNCGVIGMVYYQPGDTRAFTARAKDAWRGHVAWVDRKKKNGELKK